ncbi:MAG: hypothetical protein ACTHZ9_03760 [Leucobacter sp.]
MTQLAGIWPAAGLPLLVPPVAAGHQKGVRTLLWFILLWMRHKEQVTQADDVGTLPM